MDHNEARKQLSTAERVAALSRVGAALMSELDEAGLLHLIAETACDFTGALFAAFSLRPVNEEGQPLVPSEGHLFRLAAIVGVTQEQEALLRRMSLGGEGLLAPIFRYGVPVLCPDVLRSMRRPEDSSTLPPTDPRETARQVAFAYAHGQLPSSELRSLGVPRGHPLVRSFLGAPLLDRSGQVRGGLLLGHPEPGQFTHEDEVILVGLTAQAAVALENARLYRTAHRRVQELNAIFESIADGASLVDYQGSILRENGTAHRLQEHLKDLPEGERAIEALLHQPARRALSGEVVQDMTVTVGDGYDETRAYLVNASPLRLPPAVSGPLPRSEHSTSSGQEAVSGAVVVWHDVTEARRLLIEQRVHAETEMRRASLQLILDELPSSVYLVRGYDARLVLANRATTTIWGAVWPQDQPMREFLMENGIRICGVDGRPLTPEQLATLRAVRHGELVQQHQEIIRHPDGTTLPALVNAVALDARELHVSPSDTMQRPSGEVEPAALVVHQDVSALKEAEQLKDEFISIVAHELRNPLAVLKGFAQTLIVQTNRGKGPALADWQQEALQEIDQVTGRLDKLTGDLLDVTRLQAGRLVLHREPTDLVALTQQLMKRFQMTAQQHCLSLSTSLPALVVHVDRGRIEQVLTNLISNALKYSPQGGPIEMTIREEGEAHAAFLSIRDCGIGIPAQQQARIFGRFMRADNVQESGIGGTGLGLYLSRELIELHGGRLWFESTEGHGSIFFMVLPAASEAPSPGL